MIRFNTSGFRKALAAAARFRQGWSLRLGLVIYVVIPMCLVMFALAWLGVRGFERVVEQQMQRDLELVAKAIQGPLSHAMLREREGSIGEALKAAFELSEVYGAFLYDADGNRISPAGDPPEGELPRSEVTEFAEAGRPQGEYNESLGRRVYSHFMPITDTSGRISGLLQLTRRRSDFEETLSSLRARMLLFTGFGFVGLIGLMMLGHHQAVGKHVDALAKSMRIVSRGNRAHRHQPDGSRETRALGRHFNHMLDAMDMAEKEIRVRRESERELENRLRQSEKLAAIGELAAGVAHELGTPLSVVDARTQRLQRTEGLPPTVQKAYASIRGETARMQHIIRQLLDFSRRQPLQWNEVEAGHLLRAAAAAVETERERLGTVLELHPPSSPLPLQGDPVRLEQALVNLLRNALQAAPGGRVDLSTVHHQDEGGWRITDNGPGMDDETLHKIMEPFYTTKPVGEGTGLGLAVAHGIAGEHGGRIDVETTPGKGSVFSLLLPLSSPQSTPQPESPHA